jgi:hypothetical protein
MAHCTTCNHQFHACGSCGFADWEWDFCCQLCFDAWSDIQESPKIQTALAPISKESLLLLKNMLDGEPYIVEAFKHAVSTMLKDYPPPIDMERHG